MVEDVSDLWALERSGAVKARYHVLGGVLSALDGVRPEHLTIASLVERAGEPGVKEIILALNATVDGQTTAHYVTESIKPFGLDGHPPRPRRAGRPASSIISTRAL